MDVLKTQGSRADVLQLWNDAQTALANAASIGSLFSEIHPDKAVRDRAEAVAQEVQKLDTDLGLDHDLYAVLAALDVVGLDADATRLLERTLRDFRRAGVDRDEATRARLRELSEKGLLAQPGLQQEHPRRRPLDPGPARSSSTGMPQDWVDAHPVDEDGLVTVTTDYPDVVPFRTFATDAAARRDLVTRVPHDRVAGQRRRCSQDLFAVRRETAPLLGYDSWADYDAEVKMIGKGAAIAEFVDRITELAAEQRGPGPAVLARRGCSRTAPTRRTIDAADVALLRRARPARAARRRRPAGPHVLPLRARSARACSTSPAGSSGST